MKKITVYSGSSGLQTVVDPVRLSFDEGNIELSGAVNVRSDRTGRIGRRSGYTLIHSGDFHSLFCDGGDTFVIEETPSWASIMRSKNSVITGIVSGITKKASMGFCQVGRSTFYCNGYENGVIMDGVSAPWPTVNYEGPETTRSLSPAPLGNILGWFAGRMYVAVGKSIFWSEALNYGSFDLSQNFVQFDSDVLMLKSVAGGIFVSDEDKTFFLGGTNPNQFTQNIIADYPAHRNSQAINYIEAADIGFEINGRCAVWSSVDGVCLGMPDGKIMNVTNKKINYPQGYNNGACLIDGTHIIATIY